MWWKVAVLAVAVTTAAPLAHAPTPQSSVAFEVASVKRNISSETTSSYRTPPNGLVTITNSPLRMLIAVAYELELRMERFRLVDESNSPLMRSRGLIDDLSAPRFDVQGKIPDGSQAGQQYAMLQALLAERFKLRAHKETRPIPVYALTVARAGRLGPALRPSVMDCDEFRRERAKDPARAEPRSTDGARLCDFGLPEKGVMTLRSAGSIAALVRRLQGEVDRPLVDETGLSGTFEWNLSFEWSMSSGSLDATAIFAPLQQQLGLKLEPRTALYEVVVVESVEMPTDN